MTGRRGTSLSGGDKAFDERLSWALTLPLSALASAAAAVAVMALELALEGDDPGSAAWLALPASAFATAYAGVRTGAKIAPRRKVETAVVLSLVFVGRVLAAVRRQPAAERGWSFVAAGAVGAAIACAATRRSAGKP
ncbi:MAG TPA: hypothetical protein VNI01_04985 [Elusimicrobiota bacterium]|nr:hypothetical protein [Elusimicrobiota bacterium]